jgi:polyhydroxyalkanoate synthesis regulator protein
LTRDFLVNVIRSYGGNLQSMVSGHLDQSLKQFMSQAQGRERLKSATGDPPRLRPAGSAADDSFKRQRESDKDRDDSNLTK